MCFFFNEVTADSVTSGAQEKPEVGQEDWEGSDLRFGTCILGKEPLNRQVFSGPSRPTHLSCLDSPIRISTPMFIAASLKWAQSLQPNCPPSIINDRRMDKEWYMHKTIYLALDTEGNFDTCYNMDEPWWHHAKWNRRTQKDSHERTYMIWFYFSQVPGVVRFIEAGSRMRVGKEDWLRS